jgi:enamine deaminase RidA (YjgF/YER057c/UK114 family)
LPDRTYIAGQVPHDAAGNLVGPDDFGAQVRQVFENLKQALASAGCSFAVARDAV